MGDAVCPLQVEVKGNASDGDQRRILHVIISKIISSTVCTVQDDVLTVLPLQ